MHKGYDSCFMYLPVCGYMCLSVCLLPWNLLQTSLIHQNQGVIFLYGVSKVFVMWLLLDASFISSSVICQSQLLSSLPDELPMDRRDSNGFLSTKLVSRPSVSSYNTTDLSLITLNSSYPQELLSFVHAYVILISNYLIWYNVHSRGLEVTMTVLHWKLQA